MKENGFTLIELLAVIVILAIIALIATPIVLNIIEDSKKSAFMQTGNGIVDAAEYYYMKGMSDGAKPTENKVFTFNGSTTGLEGLEFDGEIPKGGTLTVDVNGKVELVAHNNQYCLTKGYEENEVTIKDYDGSCEISNEESSENTLATICTYDSTNGVSEKTAGAKYTCEVKEGTSYNFYVLTTPEEGSETINLIMDRNIYYDSATDTSGETTSTNKGLVAWYTADWDNSFGPVTAMDYLYNATKSWNKVPNIVMNYEDEGNGEDYGYGTIITDTNGVTKITKKDGTSVTVLTNKEGYTNLKARMPYLSEVSEYDSINKTNAYLFDYLKLANNIQANPINDIYGYWTFSSGDDSSIEAWAAACTGLLGYMYAGVVDDTKYGIRPVITVEL